MSDAYGYGGGAPPNRNAIVQALMNVQNPPGGVASPTMMPGAPPLPTQGGVAGGPPGAMGYANAGGGAPGVPLGGAPPPVPGVAPLPGGLGQPPQGPQYNPQYNQQQSPQAPQAPLLPDISQQLPPGGLPRY